MSAALQHRPMTVAAFLEWEERQPIRYEFDGERPVAMAGGSLAHLQIAGNVFAMLHTILRGGPCRPYISDGKVQVAGRIRYPDVVISCTTQLDRGLSRQGVVPEPVVVFEVLSESTASVDHTDKNTEYAATPSIQRYVMLEQDCIAATVFERDGAKWTGRPLVGAEARLSLPEVGIAAIRLGDLYDGLDFDPADSAT